MTSDQHPRYECKTRRELIESIEEYQGACCTARIAEQSGMPEHARIEASVRKRKAMEDLERVCLPIMREVAAGWMQSTLGQMVEGTSLFEADDQLTRLARSVFLEILEGLARVRIDPNRDVCALVRKMTKAALYEQNNVVNEQPKRKAKEPRQFIPLLEHHSSVDPEDTLLDATVRSKILHEITTRLEDTTYTDIDRRILHLRINGELPFADIAAIIGSEYTAASVRQRFHRMCLRLRTSLCPYGSMCTTEQTCEYCLR